MPRLDAGSHTSADEEDHGHNVGIDDIDGGDNGSTGTDSDVPSCAVCTEPLEWAAVGPCGHRVVCSACAAHVRSAPNPDHRCCVCRTICPTVGVTKAAAAEVTFSTLPAAASHDGRVGEYWYCAAVSAYCDDEQQDEAAKAVVASRRRGDW
uniref:RING-type domain-containing protein n=1 Tax=Oryza punctata TaxID=4537 RepID=A0A0E0JK90_ORYPU